MALFGACNVYGSMGPTERNRAIQTHRRHTLTSSPLLELTSALVQAIAAIALTCVLGLLVSLSTFLVIGTTSSVTYNGDPPPPLILPERGRDL